MQKGCADAEAVRVGCSRRLEEQVCGWWVGWTPHHDSWVRDLGGL